MLWLAPCFDRQATARIEYLVDGVCHQIANRLLYFSLDLNGDRMTVSGAKFYNLSVMLYGTYGLSEWDEVIEEWENQNVNR